ncbi:response regulator [Haloferax sp. ATB1]|uniref:response regulator n=1 Tax=Haloferax sp. ATB1 TaxID=1508454 RepID=UPI0005B1E034|nr:response regulator [Haloferax sp. ATB1]
MTEKTDDQGEITVLVVDDEQGLADLYALYLEDVYETRIAYNGDEALEAMDEDVDVVLLDRRMPTMPGSQVLAEFRDRGFEQPVAMLTAVDPGDDILELDIDEYFVKPMSEEELRDAVEALVARTRYDDEFREYFAVISKKSAMEANMSEQELASSDAYQTLVKEVEAAEQRADTALDEFLAADTQANFRKF